MSLSVFSHFKLSSRCDSSDGGAMRVVTAKDAHTDESMQLKYIKQKTVGTGTFGTVILAKLIPDHNDQVAIKQVLQDKRYKNRELEILRTLDHPNICHLRYYFYKQEDDKKYTKRTKAPKTYLNLVMDFMPETLYSVSQLYTKSKQRMPRLNVKLYIYQLFRALAYCHHMGICHRDIKPQNLLVDSRTGVLKLCDFGSAKRLVSGESNVAYICSRYYRAPELILGATIYTTAIDLWSAGCVMAELMMGRPLFLGKSSMDQLVEIIKILGTPPSTSCKHSPSVIQKLPRIEPKPLSQVIRSSSPDALNLMAALLQYDPGRRITAIEAMAHPYFDELRLSPTASASSSSSMASMPPPSLTASSLSSVGGPSLFDFTPQELMIRPDLKSKLVPMFSVVID